MANDPVKIPGGRRSSGGSTEAAAGAAFCRSITPQDPDEAVVIVYESGSFNRKVESATSSTLAVVVSVYVEGAGLHYTPAVTVNGTLVSNLVESTLPYQTRIFTGSIAITLDALNPVISVTHESGFSHVVSVTIGDPPPNILSASFDLNSGDFASGQTELKEGDTLNVLATFAPGAAVIEVVETDGFYHAFLPIESDAISASIPVIAKNVGSTLQNLRASLILRNNLGVSSPEFLTENTVPLNNATPTMSFVEIVYPNGQLALKNNEEAVVHLNIENADNAQYTSPNGELTIDDDQTISAQKTVTRVSGTYNVSEPNYRVVAHRGANGSTATFETVVNIANEAPLFEINILEAPERLKRASGVGATYEVSVVSNQEVASIALQTDAQDSETVLSQLSGELPGSSFTASYTLFLKTPDNFLGEQTWEVSGSGLSGLIGTSVILGGTFYIGGFETVSVIFSPAFTKIAQIGTQVSGIANVQRLTCTTQSGVVLTYVENTDNAFGSFTITNSEGVYTPDGDHLWYNDLTVTDINGTGTLSLLLRED